ncbi:MAG: LicD family protein [Patescibacteria group bacterium]
MFLRFTKSFLRIVLPVFVINLLKKIIIFFFPFLIKQDIIDSQKELTKSKIRIRTEQELFLQGLGLAEIKEIFNNLNVSYFVSGGTLLGVIREKDFIKWDWDVGIDTKLEEIYPVKNKFLSILKQSNFRIESYCPEKTNFKINAVKYNTRYEIAGFIKVGENRYRKAYNYPDSFVSKSSEIVLRGEKYKTFISPEEYLKWLYGDWKTPVKTLKKENYVTKQSRTNTWIFLFVKIISLLK